MCQLCYVKVFLSWRDIYELSHICCDLCVSYCVSFFPLLLVKLSSVKHVFLGNSENIFLAVSYLNWIKINKISFCYSYSVFLERHKISCCSLIGWDVLDQTNSCVLCKDVVLHIYTDHCSNICILWFSNLLYKILLLKSQLLLVDRKPNWGTQGLPATLCCWKEQMSVILIFSSVFLYSFFLSVIQ